MNVWRVNAGGSSPKQLTEPPSRSPICTPDRKWVYYVSFISSVPSWMRVPAEEGKAEVISGAAVPKAFSIDGGDFSADGENLCVSSGNYGRSDPNRRAQVSFASEQRNGRWFSTTTGHALRSKGRCKIRPR